MLGPLHHAYELHVDEHAYDENAHERHKPGGEVDRRVEVNVHVDRVRVLVQAAGEHNGRPYAYAKHPKAGHDPIGPLQQQLELVALRVLHAPPARVRRVQHVECGRDVDIAVIG